MTSKRPFADSHLHLLGLARALTDPLVSVDGRPHGIAEVLDAITICAQEEVRASGWVVCRGFDEALVDERRLVRRRELDDVVAGRPLRLRHRTGHASLLNTAAFDAMAVLPRHARLEVDDEGTPVMLVDAENWLNGVTGRPARACVVRGLRLLDRLLWDRGIGRVWDATPLSARGTAELLELLAEARFRSTVRTMRAPESVSADVGGLTVKLLPQPDRDLPTTVAALHARGAAVAIHATTGEEVDAASRALASCASDGIADRVEHATLLTKRQAARLAAAGANVVMHPGWLETRAKKYGEHLDDSSRRLLMAFRTAVSEGCGLAFASDGPVELPDPDRWLRCSTRPGDPRSLCRGEALDAAFGGRLWNDAQCPASGKEALYYV
jgi:predicted amidohydrolase YtcJ